MTSAISVLKQKPASLREWGYVFATLVAAYVFIAHGLECLFQHDALLPVTRYVGMDDALGAPFLFFMGLVDITVGLLLIVRPFRLLLAYAGIWVLVPLYLQYAASGQFEIVAKVLLWIALIAMFLLSRSLRVTPKSA